VKIVCPNPECPSNNGEAVPGFIVSVCVDDAGVLVENESVLGAVELGDAVCWNCDARAVLVVIEPQEPVP
jgi:hypothetical protein